MDKTQIKRTTQIWERYSDEEKAILREILHLPVAELSPEEKELKREYQREMKSRSRAGLARLDNKRTNKKYRKWLKEKGYKMNPFNEKLYKKFVREGNL